MEEEKTQTIFIKKEKTTVKIQDLLNNPNLNTTELDVEQMNLTRILNPEVYRTEIKAKNVKINITSTAYTNIAPGFTADNPLKNIIILSKDQLNVLSVTAKAIKFTHHQSITDRAIIEDFLTGSKINNLSSFFCDRSSTLFVYEAQKASQTDKILAIIFKNQESHLVEEIEDNEQQQGLEVTLEVIDLPKIYSNKATEAFTGRNLVTSFLRSNIEFPDKTNTPNKIQFLFGRAFGSNDRGGVDICSVSRRNTPSAKGSNYDVRVVLRTWKGSKFSNFYSYEGKYIIRVDLLLKKFRVSFIDPRSKRFLKIINVDLELLLKAPALQTMPEKYKVRNHDLVNMFYADGANPAEDKGYWGVDLTLHLERKVDPDRRFHSSLMKRHQQQCFIKIDNLIDQLDSSKWMVLVHEKLDKTKRSEIYDSRNLILKTKSSNWSDKYSEQFFFLDSEFMHTKEIRGLRLSDVLVSKPNLELERANITKLTDELLLLVYENRRAVIFDHKQEQVVDQTDYSVILENPTFPLIQENKLVIFDWFDVKVAQVDLQEKTYQVVHRTNFDRLFPELLTEKIGQDLFLEQQPQGLSIVTFLVASSKDTAAKKVHQHQPFTARTILGEHISAHSKHMKRSDFPYKDKNPDISNSKILVGDKTLLLEMKKAYNNDRQLNIDFVLRSFNPEFTELGSTVITLENVSKVRESEQELLKIDQDFAVLRRLKYDSKLTGKVSKITHWLIHVDQETGALKVVKERTIEFNRSDGYEAYREPVVIKEGQHIYENLFKKNRDKTIDFEVLKFDSKLDLVQRVKYQNFQLLKHSRMRSKMFYTPEDGIVLRWPVSPDDALTRAKLDRCLFVNARNMEIHEKLIVRNGKLIQLEGSDRLVNLSVVNRSILSEDLGL